MFKNYLKITIRNLKKHKGYSLINIAGLAAGMACCIFILAFIMHELSYDKFHENSDRIVRLSMDALIAERNIRIATMPAPMGPQLVEDLPEVEDVVRFRKRGSFLMKYGEKQFSENNVFHVDNSFFDVFSFRWIRGDMATALQAPYTAVLTPEMAEKYFGSEDPIGKTIVDADSGEEFKVTGVVERAPENSHFSFDMLASFETLFQRGRDNMGWDNFNYQTYLLLADGSSPQALDAKMGAFNEKYLGDFLRAIGGEVSYIVQPLTSIHLGSDLEGELQANGDIRYVYTFAAIGIFILLIACINFMNLSTARSAGRAREVGLRKVLGAEKRRLVSQFLGESFFMALLSLAVAVVLVLIFRPFFQQLAGQEIGIAFLSDPWMLAGMLFLLLFVGFAAGSYPALYLSGFTPATILRGSATRGTGNNRLRRVLVVFQFAISIALIIGTGVITGQLDYMKNMNLGFEKDQILVISLRDDAIVEKVATLKDELMSLPGVVSATATMGVPGEESFNTSVYMPEGWEKGQTVLLQNMNVDEGFLETFEIELADGRNFSREFSTDWEQTIIINETAVREMKWEDPIGKKLYYGDDADFTLRGGYYTVVGVMKDIHHRSLHHRVEPLMLYFSPDFIHRLALRVETGDIQTTIAAIETKWSEFGAGSPLDYFFLDDYFDGLYRSEERLGGIFRVFTLFAVFIGCLGLFGLVSFASERRTREIGIRKVLGSSVSAIVTMLCREFMVLVLIANLIAWPVAWLLMRKWLQAFPYQAGISLVTFITAGGLAIVIALLTVSYRAVRAAHTDPVKALRSE